MTLEQFEQEINISANSTELQTSVQVHVSSSTLIIARSSPIWLFLKLIKVINNKQQELSCI